MIENENKQGCSEVDFGVTGATHDRIERAVVPLRKSFHRLDGAQTILLPMLRLVRDTGPGAFLGRCEKAVVTVSMFRIRANPCLRAREVQMRPRERVRSEVEAGRAG